MAALPDWLSELLAEYDTRLMAFCRQLACSHHQDAEDLYAETMSRVVTNWPQYSRERPFCPWLFTIARNHWISIQRRRGNNVLSLDEEIDSTQAVGPADREPPPLDGLITRENAARMATAITNLPPDEKAALQLHYVDGLACPDVATILARPVGTVYRLLHTARHRLAAAFPELNPVG